MDVAVNPTRPGHRLYHTLWSAVDWFYPPHCGGCDRLGERWCARCDAAVLPIAEPACPVCSLPGSRGICPHCRAHRPAFQALRSWGLYEGPLRTAIHRLKYHNDIGLSETFSSKLLAVFQKTGWVVDGILPVPLNHQRMRQRGYNQAALLAYPLSLACGIHWVPAALQRNRDTASQVGLSVEQRLANVDGAFRADEKLVRERTFLLVDDVATTTSTLQACAAALLDAGAAGVYALTLARAFVLHDPQGI
ncbi:MAG: ComF family protein [Chloroflexi bacterium]|nr:ComF family protein [Chloroflexota bacterium]